MNALEKRRGRPRSKSKPGEAHSEGNPLLTFRAPEDVARWVKAQPHGYILRLVEQDMSRH